jgi:hypothetical protein
MTRHPTLALLVALVLVLVGPSVAAQDATPTSGASVLQGAITDMRYLVPFTPDGLNPRLHATATADGTCADASAQALDRPDAWSCIGSDNQVYDPCFENPFILPDQPGQVACADSPFSPEVVVLELTQPVARQKEVQAPDTAGAEAGGPGDEAADVEMESDNPYSIDPWDLPWGLELANGEQCTLSRGTLSVLAGQTVHYGCTGGGAILGEVRHWDALWTVNYLAAGDVASTLVPVAAAWS